MKTVDCRNMACPVPVVTTKRALEASPETPLVVLVDAGAPRENVTRFAVNRGYQVQELATDGGFSLSISRDAGNDSPSSPVPAAIRPGGSVMMITSDRLGNDSEELGHLLMKNFIITLLDLEQIPDKMLFLNSGVKLTCAGSEVLEALEKLGNRGTEIYSCGICLDFYHLKEQLKAGVVTNMFTTAESLMQAPHVICI